MTRILSRFIPIYRWFLAFILIGSAVPAWAQRTGPPTSTTSNPGTGISSVGNTSSIPPGTGNNIPSMGYPQPIFLAGNVLFDDGTKPNIDIVVDLVCNGIPHPQGHTDSKGHFSFQVGQNPQAIDVQDASVDGSRGPLGAMGMPTATGIGQPTTQNTDTGRAGRTVGMNSNPLFGCEVLARYPGFRSDSVNVGLHRPLDSPNVGTIFLHRLTNVQGTTISATTAEAPKSAVKDYQKGLRSAQQGKLADAEKHFQEAVDAYPKYAIAWFALGDTQRGEGHLDLAAKSYKSAIAADSKYVSPYDRLALLAAQSSNWKDAEDYSKQVIALNPVEFPASFLYNAVAALNLKKPAEAEESARELMKIDTGHRFQDAEAVLSEALLAQGKYSEAATHIRSYLAHYPDSKEAASLKQALAKIDPASAVAKN